jgi:signal transduction histidine kinase
VSAARRVGLRARLAIALVGVAVLAVGLATLLANRGLHPRVAGAAEARIQRSAEHMAEAAASVYRENGGWTPGGVETLEHLADLNRLALRVSGPGGARLAPGHSHPALGDAEISAAAPVVVGKRIVGKVLVAPLSGKLLTPEEEHLQASLDRLHLIAGAVSVAAALLVAFLLAQTLSGPLRRIRMTAQRIEQGELGARVELGGDAEVRAVGHALNRLADTLQHEEELRKESVADVAHELRTPVSGLLSRIEAAQDGVLADAAANLEAMHAEALRLTRLLDDLARLAEAERPGLLIEKRYVDLAEVAREELERFRLRFAEKGIEVEESFATAPVNGDPKRLGQVAANLLSNALRYTEPGGRVRVRVATERGSALLEVADTGVGIAPDDLKHVFKRFWRGEKSRSRATGGTGIGLAIVQELVRAHDGRIDVESAPGRGSAFRVFVPVVHE